MLEEYKKAQKKAEKQVSDALRNKSEPFLQSLDQLIDINKAAREDLGTFEIPLQLVRGSANSSRANAFSNEYLPLLNADSEFAFKWARVYEYQIEEGINDAILCYEYLGYFYVSEGNKRVSVLKYLESPLIYAHIIRIYPLEKDEVYEEFLRFYDAVGIYNIRFNRIGNYKKLAALTGIDPDKKASREQVNALLAAYLRFEGAYLNVSRNSLRDSISDAFLIYLQIYGYNSILDIAPRELENRIDILWEEILNDAANVQADIIEDPKDVPETDNVFKRLSSVISIKPKYSEKNPLKVAFLHRYDPEVSAWSREHFKAENTLKKMYGDILQTFIYRYLKNDENMHKAAENAILNGCDVIFTLTPEDMEITHKLSLEYPDVRFYNCSLNQSYPSVPTFYCKLYEVKFLMGALAASLSEGDTLGYIADYPIYGCCANINAFAIGAALINPNARIRLLWSTSDRYLWRDIIEQENITVVSAHDLTKPEWGTDERGLFKKTDSSQNQKIAEIIYHWEKYYDLILQDIFESSTQENTPLNYWYGIATGVIDIRISDDLSYYSHKLIDRLKEALVYSRLSPFEGEVHSQSATVKPRYSANMSNREIIEMNWLNDNVDGSIIKEDEMIENARTVVNISGIEK